MNKVEQIAELNSDRAGRCYQFVWRGALSYRLKFAMRVTQLTPSCLIESLAGVVDSLGILFYQAIARPLLHAMG
jgi:hypothetical protein